MMEFSRQLLSIYKIVGHKNRHHDDIEKTNRTPQNCPPTAKPVLPELQLLARLLPLLILSRGADGNGVFSTAAVYLLEHKHGHHRKVIF
jgi:hypothetical protein